MSWIINFLATWAAKIFESWYAHKQSEAKGASDAELRGVRAAEKQEAMAKEIDSRPPPKDETDAAFHPKYWRD
jgi:hypothetical protein